ATSALRGEDERERVLAVAFRLLDRTAIRIGSPGYLRRYGSRGLTTLRWADVTWRDTTITLSFRGKMNLIHTIEFDDEDLIAWIVSHPAHPPRAFVLRYRDGSRRRAIGPADVNAFLAEAAGEPFTAKDFRTLHGTIVAATELARIGPRDTDSARRRAVSAAMRATAAALGNTPAVARSGYVDPRVLDLYDDGIVVDTGRRVEPQLGELLA
ncbi:MAG TPA: DNA topoisomerase IB, partial [Microbacterium sp.]|nr:DNA topoisomerase IB [Microbacterium sp.]